MVVLRDPSDPSPASVTLDYDSSSGANNTGVTLDQPALGWKEPLTETEYLCFFDAKSWKPADRSPTVLPAGCEPASPPINTSPPQVSTGAGTPEPGQQFTATPGSWENANSFATQWSRCIGAACEPIPGAAGTAYTAALADVGHYLRVTETATAPGGEADSADSNIAGSLSGHVKEGEEELLAKGAPVQACLVGGGACRSTSTDEAGFYRIQAPISGEYEVTAFPPAGSKAIQQKRPTPTVVSDETETTGQDVVLSLPPLPPPTVGFSGAGARGTTSEGVPVVHWQEPFVITYETGINHNPEVIFKFPDGPELTFPPSGPPTPNPDDPENGDFRFPVPPLYPHHGPADITIKDPPKDSNFPIYIDPSGFVRTISGTRSPAQP